MSKKIFKLNTEDLTPTEMIMPSVKSVKEQEFKQPLEETKRGYKLIEVRESKTKRLQLLVRPSTVAELKNIAIENNTSLNNLINQILENYLDQE